MTAVRRVTAPMAVTFLNILEMPPITAATIYNWADRGKVRKYGRDAYGLQQYDLDDIMRMVSADAAPTTPAA